MSLQAGTRLGVYEILGPLGAGGMGEVYRAKDTRLERTVALKVLPDEYFEDEERVVRFEREAKLLAALNHPNIAAIYSFEEIPGSPGPPGSSGRHILVMELLEGETLRERLRAGPLPPRRAIDVTVQMAHALAAAHEKGIVHRDLKPENVFLTKDDRVKLLDFGLAKLSPQARAEEELTSAGTRSLLTEAGVVFGTVGYMSPEQVRGEPIDARSDIF
ncbi:MAG TPA: serine/threonine-protein kinase, partial [Thermoanaerobaculia bacterium]|nr:serine/threonine-protein kinase [Thermoanaerobaculia bacterium]